MDCEPSSLFKPQEYTLPESVQTVTKLVGIFTIFHINIYNSIVKDK